MAPAPQRVLAILELLSQHPGGMPLNEVSQRLSIPLSATHRLLGELQTAGYVRRVEGNQYYAISLKLVSLALDYLSEVELVDHAKPIIDHLARETGTLARLSLVDSDRLIWVLRSQGRRSNIRYDPATQHVVALAATANGHAWLSQLDEERARELIMAQGEDQVGQGSEAPRTTEQVLERVAVAREQGWAYVQNSNEEGIAALAVPIVVRRHDITTGVLSLSGLNAQFDATTIEEYLPLLQSAADELADVRLDYAKYLVSRSDSDAYAFEDRRWDAAIQAG